MRFVSSSEFDRYLKVERPEQVEVRIDEATVHPQHWGEAPYSGLAQIARENGYEVVNIAGGGTAPHRDWFGPGTRYATFTALRPASASRSRDSYEGSASSFLRVWSAGYLLDAATSTHTSRVVSGTTISEVMAEATRKTPKGARLVYLCREDDFEPVWYEETGFTMAANVSHEYQLRSGADSLFRDLEVGAAFRRGRSYDNDFVKVDDRHFLNRRTGGTAEIDPYEGVWLN